MGFAVVFISPAFSALSRCMDSNCGHNQKQHKGYNFYTHFRFDCFLGCVLNTGSVHGVCCNCTITACLNVQLSSLKHEFPSFIEDITLNFSDSLSIDRKEDPYLIN